MHTQILWKTCILISIELNKCIYNEPSCLFVPFFSLFHLAKCSVYYIENTVMLSNNLTKKEEAV